MTAIVRWTGNDARAFQQAAGLTNERLAERLKVSVRTVAYWRKQPYAPLPDLAQRVLTQALDDAPEPVRQRFDELLNRTAPVIETIDEALATAAQEATAEEANLATRIDPESMDWLWGQSLEIARAGNRPAFEIFTAARRVRRGALDLTGRTRRPATLSDLYVIAGQATALMASTAFDLNRWDVSARLASSAVSYAALSGHASLQAWTLGLAALLANWRNEPDTALDHFHQAIQAAPTGTPKVRLLYIASRSHALLGDMASVAEVLRQARREQEQADQHPDPLSQETGGEFAFSGARAAACAAAAWLDLGHGPEAQEAAQEALAELSDLPAARVSLSQLNGARIDLASAHLLTRDPDATGNAIQDVLALPPRFRNISLAGRMTRLKGALTSPQWRKDLQARQLADAITNWLAEFPPDFAQS